MVDRTKDERICWACHAVYIGPPGPSGKCPNCEAGTPADPPLDLRTSNSESLVERIRMSIATVKRSELTSRPGGSFYVFPLDLAKEAADTIEAMASVGVRQEREIEQIKGSVHETPARRHEYAKPPGQAGVCWCGNVHLEMMWGAQECPECRGTGKICAGNSGTEADGYAPTITRCEVCDGSGLAVKAELPPVPVCRQLGCGNHVESGEDYCTDCLDGSGQNGEEEHGS